MPSLAMAARADVQTLSDEELVRSAREKDSSDALRELVARHCPRMKRLLSLWARTTCLGPADRDDARQDVAFALWQAIEDFGSQSGDLDRAVCFRSFLWSVLRDRFLNFVRNARRRERILDRSARAEDVLEKMAGALRVDGLVYRREAGVGDPAVLMSWRELWACLNQAVLGLTEPARQLWEAQKTGQSLRASAALTGMSYDQAKRLRRQVFAQLRLHLNDWAEST
jgi:RNA polymerase sigma factor (sigma-70 family)